MWNLERRDAGAERFCDGGGALCIGFWKNDRELFAAITGHEISGAIQCLMEVNGDLFQAVVATLMAIGIVESLEKVGINHDQRERHIGTTRAPPLQVEHLLEMTAVSDPRQAIQAGQTLQMLIRLLKLSCPLVHQMQALFHQPSDLLPPHFHLPDTMAI